MKARNIIPKVIIILGATGFLVSIVCNLTRQKVEFIRHVLGYEFNDTIVDIYQSKDDNGPGIITKFAGKDSLRFCFYGKNKSTGSYFPGFARTGDVIVKKSNSDSFFLKRNDSIYGFRLESR